MTEASSDPIAEVHFDLEVAGTSVTWVPTRMRFTEGLSELFELTLDVAATDPDADASAMLGKNGVFTFARGPLERQVRGFVVGVEDRGLSSDHRLARIALAPALWRLGQRSNYRIFQDLDAIEVVKAVLKDADVYQGDGRVDTSRLTEQYPRREYCVQYGETDLDFVRRLLEDEGVSWYFTHDDLTDTLVLTDSARVATSPRAQTLDGGAVLLTGGANSTYAVETLHRLALLSETRPSGVTQRDFNYTTPDNLAGMTSSQPVASGNRTLYEYGRQVIGEYDIGQHVYKKANGAQVALARFEAETATATLGRGAGNVTGFRAGSSFQLQLAVDGTSTDDVQRRKLDDRKFLLVRVTHTGNAPEVLHAGSDGGGPEDRYSNRFECIPEGVNYRPPLVAARPRALSPQSAVVIGRPHSTEEIETDFYGRILVKFQWDRPELRTQGQTDKQSSCWIRAMQPWAGAGWGSVFIPRVGMEVVVQFLDGNPDRPLVVGCVYNGVNRPPLELPAHKTRSVLRTNSSPTYGGYNELRFEDLAHHEEIALRAQKDLNELVLHDHTLRVKRNETIHIDHDALEEIGNNHSMTVRANETWEVRKNRQTNIRVDDITEVDGNHSVTIHESGTLHADHTHTITTDEGVFIEVGGGGGSSLHMKPDEITVRAPSTLTFECGDSRIVMTPSGITVSTAAGAKVALEGPNVNVEGAAMVTIKGVLVKIN